MTGFGRAVEGQLRVEIQAVNRKHLDISVSLPNAFSRFECEVRRWVAARVQRGAISVRVIYQPLAERLVPKPELLRSLKREWERLAEELGSPKEEITLEFLLSHLPQAAVAEEGSEELLQKVVEEALNDFVRMRRTEGVALSKELLERATNIAKFVEAIAAEAPQIVPRLRQKLQERLKELFTPGVEWEERLLKEVAIYAEKADISEEIVRLRSHLEQFERTIRSTEGAGKKLEFLIQEMAREANTTAAKAGEAALVHLAVELKSELEKLREQIQNVE
jgi:uncharacterized protein (TIGR00255 family)